MLTRLRIKNFKKLSEADIELGQYVIFIGPNNSGKTTALQALALWEIGVKKWYTTRVGDPKDPEKPGRASDLPEKRPGITINRRDLISIPIPNTNLLWQNLHLRDNTTNVRIEIIVNGESNGTAWECGMEFDYANDESFYCRPLRLSNGEGNGETNGENKAQPPRMPVPSDAARTTVAYLPPMSGLAAVEPKVERGRIDVLLGEGQTAQVLRNLCHQIYSRTDDPQHDVWGAVVTHIKTLFGVELLPPRYVSARGEITMAYREGHQGKRDHPELDLSAAGRGLQQTLLLLAHLYTNPGAVLLLDEPDAHLEILRQRQNYQMLSDVAKQQGSQIIAASHSEVVLNEAAERDLVIGFIGTPRRMNERKSQLLKALRDIGFEQYAQAAQKGWVLYLEGSTDLNILQAFAKTLGHPAADALAAPFVQYVANNPQKARDNFWGLHEGYPSFVGLALFDRLDRSLQSSPELTELMWRRREIENYLCSEYVLMEYARGESLDPIFSLLHEKTMGESINALQIALETLGKPTPWSPDLKVTDDFLDPLFANYFRALGLSNQMTKGNYHQLARFVPANMLDPEVREKLDQIWTVAQRAQPGENE